MNKQAKYDGSKTHQPDEMLFASTLAELSCPVFFKGNLDLDLADRHGGWREEFPDMGKFPEEPK